jgi:hypothetical protein
MEVGDVTEYLKEDRPSQAEIIDIRGLGVHTSKDASDQSENLD